MGDQAERDGHADPDMSLPAQGGERVDAVPRPDHQQVIDLHHRAVYRYAYRLTGRVADAEDLTQQTFLIAQQKLGQLRDETKADRWLFAVVRSCFSKNRRRRRPTSAVNLELNMDAVAVEPPPGESIDRELLDRALDELPDDVPADPGDVLLRRFFLQTDCPGTRNPDGNGDEPPGAGQTAASRAADIVRLDTENRMIAHPGSRS